MSKVVYKDGGAEGDDSDALGKLCQCLAAGGAGCGAHDLAVLNACKAAVDEPNKLYYTCVARTVKRLCTCCIVALRCRGFQNRETETTSIPLQLCEQPAGRERGCILLQSGQLTQSSTKASE